MKKTLSALSSRGSAVLIVMAALLLCSNAAPAAAEDMSFEELDDMRRGALEELYLEVPYARKSLETAVAYGVFTNVGVNLAFLSANGGQGIIHNISNGRERQMNMLAAGVGLGLGFKHYRTILIFHNDQAFRRFIEGTWDISGQADIAAKVSDFGEARSSAVSARDGISIYQFTDSGLSLQTSFQGSRYWQAGGLSRLIDILE